jgi:hypothetical protein
MGQKCDGEQIRPNYFCERDQKYRSFLSLNRISQPMMIFRLIFPIIH